MSKKFIIHLRIISPLITISIISLLIYLPFILSPNTILERNNDLQEQFWPVFYFIHDKFWQFKQIPLWNSLFLAGTPLLPDPQFSLYYPPNWIFIILKTNYAFFVWLILHTILSGIGMFFVLNRFFKFTYFTSIVGSIIYMTSPTVANYLEAGHYGLVGTYAWLPYLLLSLLFLHRNNNLKWLILAAISLSGLFYTHTIIYGYSIVLSFFLLLRNFKFDQNIILLTFKQFTLIILLTFCLTAVTFLPQLIWSKDTTRFLLLDNKQIYPIWNGIEDFVLGLFPWIKGITGIHTVPTEKWISVSPIIFASAFIGFWNVSKKLKYKIILFVSVSFILILSNISPLYSQLLSVDAFVLSRVTTRIWFLIEVIIILLACYTLQIVFVKKKKYATILVVILLIESISVFYFRTFKPIEKSSLSAPKEIYEYLSNDNDIFRVFCTTRCLTQKQAAIYNLELLDGYNTLHQTNYYKHMWQLTGKYWNYYSLSVPPLGIYKFEEIYPSASFIGEYNVKYVVSPHIISSEDFTEVANFENFRIYKNKLLKARVYTQNEQKIASPKILKYSPNEIIVDINRSQENNLILSEVFSSGWEASLDGKKLTILETPNALQKVDLTTKGETVKFTYNPKGYHLGLTITLITLPIISIIFVRKIFKTK